MVVRITPRNCFPATRWKSCGGKSILRPVPAGPKPRGGTAAARLRSHGPRAQPGVIHRDLKPANILVGAFGNVRVVDWGSAHILESSLKNFEDAFVPLNSPAIETDRSRAMQGNRIRRWPPPVPDTRHAAVHSAGNHCRRSCRTRSGHGHLCDGGDALSIVDGQITVLPAGWKMPEREKIKKAILQDSPHRCARSTPAPHATWQRDVRSHGA